MNLKQMQRDFEREFGGRKWVPVLGNRTTLNERQLEIVWAYMVSLLKDQMKEFLSSLEWMFVKAVDSGFSQRRSKKAEYDIVKRFLVTIKQKQEGLKR